MDTDLYKLTMQCAVLKHFPKVNVAYSFNNRTPHMKLNLGAFQWLQKQVDRLGNIQITEDEIQWLETTCPYLGKDYLSYLKTFQLKPKEQIMLSFAPDEGDKSQTATGSVLLGISGLWVETILYEIPLLALVSEAYFKFIDKDWTHDRQVANAKDKGLRLLQDGCVFSEFGSRRRRDYRTHELIMQGLVGAQKEADTNNKGWKGKFSGTSNVHFAMKFGVAPIGTVAHEWFMAIAAITEDYTNANELAMQYWTATFGRGVLAIALTDTFGTPAFLRAFEKPATKSGSTEEGEPGNDPSYAEVFTGVRQDSGDPLEFLHIVSNFYRSQGITDKKVVVYSDSLDVEKCCKYRAATVEAGLTPSFGVGTFFTNDFKHVSNGEKSVPLNIVIKLSHAEGRPAVKLSDNKGKNTGDEELVRKAKEAVGYEEHEWREGDEAHRWDK